MSRNASTPFRTLWGWPIVLGLLTASGLATALISDTWGDWWSWVGLGVPVAVMAWFAWRPTHTPTATAGDDNSDADSTPS